MDEIQKRTKTALDGESILQKAPISKEKIFKIMLYLTYIIAGMFFLKNIIGKAWWGSIIIGISITIFSIVVIVMKVIHAKEKYQQFAVAMGLIFLVFIISINSGDYYSGDYYSDDFPLYLADRIIFATELYKNTMYYGCYFTAYSIFFTSRKIRKFISIFIMFSNVCCGVIYILLSDSKRWCVYPNESEKSRTS